MNALTVERYVLRNVHAIIASIQDSIQKLLGNQRKLLILKILEKAAMVANAKRLIARKNTANVSRKDCPVLLLVSALVVRTLPRAK